MPLLVTLNSFTGLNQLARSTATDPKLQEYIDQYEEEYIIRLLGKELGELFIEDKSNPSQEARFAIIEHPFTEQENECLYISKGMKQMLTDIIFYYYVVETQTGHTQSGVANKQAEAGKVRTPDDAARKAERRFNDCLKTWDAIQWYCKTFARDDYPEYKGQHIGPIYSPIL